MFDCYNSLFITDKIITTETLSNKFLGISDRRIKLIEASKDHNDQIKEFIGNGFAHGTWERYKTSLRHTLQFMK